MKFRNLLLIITLLILTFPTYSQHFNGGLLLGFTGSQIDGDHYSGYSKLGITGGAFVSYPLNEILAIQGEIKLIMKGATKPLTTIDPSIYSVSLYYVEMPLLVSYKANKKVNIEAGLATGYLAYATNDLGDGPELPSPAFNKTDFSVLTGISYSFTEQLFVNIRFQYSFLPSRGKPTSPTNYWNDNQYNNLLVMSVYYKPRLGK